MAQNQLERGGEGLGGSLGLVRGGLGWVHIGSKLMFFYTFVVKIDFVFEFFMFLAQNLLGRGGPEGPQMRARRAPQCPPQELEGRACRALNF